jgi:SAM-dependent methyltransferase
MTKPFSAACERNREPILAELRRVLPSSGRVLEIGSGTGQHAVYFGAALPALSWQTSDLPSNHPGIHAWLAEEAPSNVLPPLELDVRSGQWPAGPWDAVFTANTCHIMAWDEVVAMLTGAARALRAGGTLCVYGPFNYAGQFTSESNALFDMSLKAQGEHMGLRNFEDVNGVAQENGLVLQEDCSMPANNRLLVWKKESE